LGTSFRVVVHCPDEQAAARAEWAVIRRLAELDEVFDADRPSSEVSQVYANAGLGAVRVSDELYALLSQADRMSNRSEGVYDLTAGALAKLWRDSVEAGRLPTDAENAAARARVGRKKLRFNAIDRTVHLTEPGVVFDLEGIAQAYSCGRVLSALRRAGFPSALVEAGDRIAVGDPPPGQKGWRIRINDADPKSRHRFVTLSRQAIASSSRLADRVTIDGQEYARLVNPHRGVGTRNVAAVTVVAPSASQAALLARAAQVAGQTQGEKLIRSTRGARAWFHYPPGQRPATRPATRPRQPQTQPIMPGDIREIRREGVIRQ
jgi:thiamine biosynthesis lipoprotein